MLVNHLLVALFVVISPIAGYISYQRLVAKSQRGEYIDRMLMYRTTLATQWLLCVAGVAIWAVSGKPWADVGFAFTLDPAFAVALVLTIAIVIWLIMQLREVRSASTAQLEIYKRHLGTVELIVPSSREQLQSFRRVAISAGVVEEFLWRGFLIWYLSQYLTIWYAAGLATILFGLAHAYQGWRKVPQLALVGSAFTILYLMTGSLLLPVALHIAFDLLQGQLAFEIVSRNNKMQLNGVQHGQHT